MSEIIARSIMNRVSEQMAAAMNARARAVMMIVAAMAMVMVVSASPWHYQWNVNTPTSEVLDFCAWTTNYRVTDIATGAEIPSTEVQAPNYDSTLTVDASSWASTDGFALKLLVNQFVSVANVTFYGAQSTPFIVLFPQDISGRITIYQSLKLHGNITFRSDTSPQEQDRGAAITIMPDAKITVGSMIRSMEPERPSIITFINGIIRSDHDDYPTDTSTQVKIFGDDVYNGQAGPIQWNFIGFNYAPLLYIPETSPSYVTFNFRVTNGATLKTGGINGFQANVYVIGTIVEIKNGSTACNLQVNSITTEPYGVITLQFIDVQDALTIAPSDSYDVFNIRGYIGLKPRVNQTTAVSIWGYGEYPLQLTGQNTGGTGYTLEGSWRGNVVLKGFGLHISVVGRGFWLFNPNNDAYTIDISTINSIDIAAGAVFGAQPLSVSSQTSINCYYQCSLTANDGSVLLNDFSFVNVRVALTGINTVANGTTWQVDGATINVAHPHNINPLRYIRVRDDALPTRANTLVMDQLESEVEFVKRLQAFEIVGGSNRTFVFNIRTVDNDRTVDLTEWIIGGNGQVVLGPATVKGVMTIATMSEDEDESTLFIATNQTVTFIKGALETNVNTAITIAGSLIARARDSSSLFFRGKATYVKSGAVLYGDLLVPANTNLFFANGSAVAGRFAATSSDTPKPGMIIEGRLEIASGGLFNITGIDMKHSTGAYFYLGGGLDGIASLAQDVSLTLDATHPTIICRSDDNYVWLHGDAQLFIPDDMTKLPSCRFVTQSPFTIPSPANETVDVSDAHFSTSSNIELGTSATSSFRVADGQTATFVANRVNAPGKLSGQGTYLFGCTTNVNFGSEGSVEVSYIKWRQLTSELSCPTIPTASFANGVTAEVQATSPLNVNISYPGGVVYGRVWNREIASVAHQKVNSPRHGKVGADAPLPLFNINAPLLVAGWDTYRNSFTIQNYDVRINAAITSWGERSHLAFHNSQVTCSLPCIFNHYPGIDVRAYVALENGTTFSYHRDDDFTFADNWDISSGSVLNIGSGTFTGSIGSESIINILGPIAVHEKNPPVTFTGDMTYLDNPYARSEKANVGRFIINAQPNAGDVIVEVEKALDVTFNLAHNDVQHGGMIIRGTRLTRVIVNADKGRDTLPVNIQIPDSTIEIAWLDTSFVMPPKGPFSVARAAGSTKALLVWDNVNVTLGSNEASELDIGQNVTIATARSYIASQSLANNFKVLVRDGATLVIQQKAFFISEASIQVWGTLSCAAQSVTKIKGTLRIDGGNDGNAIMTLGQNAAVSVATLLVPKGSTIEFGISVGTGLGAAVITAYQSVNIAGKLRVVQYGGGTLADDDYTLFIVPSKDITIPTSSVDITLPQNGLLVIKDDKVVLRIGQGHHDDDSSNGMSGGTIAGIIIGSLAGVAVMAGVCLCVRRRRNKANSDDLFERLAT